jgi:endonuclease/exonuclease/phosphatase family metal-dependent hydrolase
MQLVCLNVWGGKRFEALAHFLKGMAPETDIFCMQEVFYAEHQGLSETAEVRPNLLTELAELLPRFAHTFAPLLLTHDLDPRGEKDVAMGPAIFSRAPLRSLGHGSVFVAGSLSELTISEAHPVGLLLHETFAVGSKQLTVANVHGIATWPKSDTTLRLAQSKHIREALNGLPGPKVLCGDFNLFPDTKSIAVLGHDLKNLMVEFNIQTTRSTISREKYRGQAVHDTVSDYVFTSPGITPTTLKVPEVTVSDHLPLVLEFSLD